MFSMNPWFWTFLNIMGVFSNIFIYLVILIIIQYLVCKYYYKYGLLIPILCFIFMVYKIINYFSIVYTITSLNSYYLVYGLLLIIPYGSLFFGTFIVYSIFKKKIIKQQELIKTKINDL